jgi:GT2 family glycosyltransferase
MARNVGADAAPIGTKILIFIDADCIPAHPNFVANHIAEFETGAELAFGGIDVPGEGFWTLLQRKINATRRERFLSGDPLAFTSANFSIKRELFQRHGGFDLAFGRYGFEDRDLFARLEDSGIRGRYALDAPVIHMDSQSLRSICEKQSEAGLHGASIFRARHLRAYRAMGASRMDSDLHQWLRIVDKFFWPVAQRVAALPDSWLEWAWVPFGIRSTLARFVYSLHFLHGTCQKYKC